MPADICWYGAYVAGRAVEKVFLKLRRSRGKDADSQCLSPMAIFRLAGEPLGIEVRDLGCETFELRHGGQVRTFQHMTSDLENAFAYWVTGHKYMTFEMLRRAGITELPRYRVHTLRTAGEARRDLRERGREVVVKPCFGTSGAAGVTVGITKERDLSRAIYKALCHDREYLVEDFVEGDHYRLLLSSGRLISALKRLPASVVGDGAATIRELVDRENARRSRLRGLTALFKIQVDDDLCRHLEVLGKGLRTVPVAGERVFVRSVSNFCRGGETEDVTDLVCPETVDLCRRAASVLRITLAGLDLITKDITRPLRETGGVINEVNTSPTLLPHYAVRNREKARDVARDILLDMFPSARPESQSSSPTNGHVGTHAGRWRRPQLSEPGQPELGR